MKIRKPDYYDQFHCIAGACQDSCCIGWEIDVDEERQKEYRTVTGKLGEKLKNCIDWEQGQFILQGEEERCPFLNEDHLCELILGLGEGALCEICREHPRYYEWYGGVTEVGVGLCCEAAARLILEKEAPAYFITEEKTEQEENETPEEEVEADLLCALLHARNTAYRILQNRKLSIWERIEQFCLYIEEIQDALDFGSVEEIEESAEYYQSVNLTLEIREEGSLETQMDWYIRLIEVCRRLEVMDESWPETLDELERLLHRENVFWKAKQDLQQAENSRDYEYEHLAIYFVYRYFMKCRTDGDVYSKGMLMGFCLSLIHLLDILAYSKTGALTKEDRVQNAKRCSKEIEYSEENLKALAEVFWDS